MLHKCQQDTTQPAQDFVDIPPAIAKPDWELAQDKQPGPIQGKAGIPHLSPESELRSFIKDQIQSRRQFIWDEMDDLDSRERWLDDPSVAKTLALLDEYVVGE